MRKLILAGLFVCAAAVAALGQDTPGTVKYPSAIDSRQSLFETADRAATQTTAPIAPTDTTINVKSTNGFSSTGALVINGLETVFYTGKTQTSFTGVIRAREGSVASFYQPFVPVEERIIAAHHRVLTDSTIAIEQKVGSGSTIPEPNTLLIGILAGQSAWQSPTQLQMTTWLGFTPENPANKNQAGGYPGLDSNGKLSSAVLPAIAVTDTFVVSDQPSMLALPAHVGDVAIRTDMSETFILQGLDPTQLSSWQLLLFPTGGVSNFNGRTGPVSLQSSDILAALGYTPLNRGGDTMTGALILNAAPSVALGAATKGYVDAAIASLTGVTTANLTVSPAGGLAITGGTGAVFGSGTNISLGPNVPTSVTNDTNIQGVINTNVLTLSWAGQLGKTRIVSTAVYVDQVNTYGAFLQDFSAALLKVPVSAGYAPTANGSFGYDSTSNQYVGGVGGATKFFTVLGNSVTGSGGVLVEQTSPSLTTPNIGVATATSVNKVTITQPATGATLTLSDGKTLSATNTTTVQGTDGQVLTFQGTDTYVGRATTDSLTNKTLDGEAPGNSIKQPVQIWILGASCNNSTAAPNWDLPTSSAPTPNCLTGTNIQKGVLDFPNTSGGFSAQQTLLIPTYWNNAASVDARIVWLTPATSGNAIWQISVACSNTDGSVADDATFNTASSVTTAAPTTANRATTSAVTGISMSGCVAGGLMHLKVFRNGGADTVANTVRLVGVMLTLRRK
ncbi:MAG: hypothetical protein ACREDR_00915 [Blastocatellia bacterium]